jgi:hypothetical protein
VYLLLEHHESIHRHVIIQSSFVWYVLIFNIHLANCMTYPKCSPSIRRNIVITIGVTIFLPQWGQVEQVARVCVSHRTVCCTSTGRGRIQGTRSFSLPHKGKLASLNLLRGMQLALYQISNNHIVNMYITKQEHRQRYKIRPIYVRLSRHVIVQKNPSVYKS